VGGGGSEGEGFMGEKGARSRDREGGGVQWSWVGSFSWALFFSFSLDGWMDGWMDVGWRARWMDMRHVIDPWHKRFHQ